MRAGKVPRILSLTNDLSPTQRQQLFLQIAISHVFYSFFYCLLIPYVKCNHKNYFENVFSPIRSNSPLAQSNPISVFIMPQPLETDDDPTEEELRNLDVDENLGLGPDLEFQEGKEERQGRSAGRKQKRQKTQREVKAKKSDVDLYDDHFNRLEELGRLPNCQHMRKNMPDRFCSCLNFLRDPIVREPVALLCIKEIDK